MVGHFALAVILAMSIGDILYFQCVLAIFFFCRAMLNLWKPFLLCWQFVRGIHRSPMDFPYKEQVMRSFRAFSVAGLNDLLNKLSSSQWYERPWRSCGVIIISSQLHTLVYGETETIFIWCICITAQLILQWIFSSWLFPVGHTIHEYERKWYLKHSFPGIYVGKIVCNPRQPIYHPRTI